MVFRSPAFLPSPRYWGNTLLARFTSAPSWPLVTCEVMSAPSDDRMLIVGGAPGFADVGSGATGSSCSAYVLSPITSGTCPLTSTVTAPSDCWLAVKLTYCDSCSSVELICASKPASGVASLMACEL